MESELIQNVMNNVLSHWKTVYTQNYKVQEVKVEHECQSVNYDKC